MYKLLIIFIVSAALAGCSTLQRSAEISFRGEHLGSLPSTGMRKLEKFNPDIDVAIDDLSDGYVKYNEVHKLGQSNVENVVYQYYKNRLYQVKINLESRRPGSCLEMDEIKMALEETNGISMQWVQKDFISRTFIAQWRGRDSWVTYMCYPTDATNTILLEETKIRSELEDALEALESKKSKSRAMRIEKDLK
ncbi:MAG TPA: hypothetical protein PLS22_05940 [Aquabacterium sp.]|nr:hypothetical protein [Aquabacterium sp.]